MTTRETVYAPHNRDEPEMEALAQSFDDEVEEILPVDIATLLMTTLMTVSNPMSDPEDEERMTLFANAIHMVETYKEAGMLTPDAGVVLTMADQSEYRLTIHKARQ